MNTAITNARAADGDRKLNVCPHPTCWHPKNKKEEGAVTLMDRKTRVLLRGPQLSMVGFMQTFCTLYLSLLAIHTSRPQPYLKATLLDPTPSFEVP